MPGLKNIVGAACVVALVSSPAFAGAADNAPLAAGMPAGVKQAQISNGTLLVGAVGVAVVAAVAIVVSNQSTDRSQPVSGGATTVTTFLSK